MKLKNLLNRMRPSDYIKVGTEFGSNFILAGTVEAVSAESEKITPKLRKQCDKKSVQFRKTLNEAIEKYSGSESEAEKGYLQAAYTRYERLEATIRNFQPIGDRTIIDSFYAHPIIDDVDHVFVVMVESVEDRTFTKITAEGKGVKMD